MDFQIMPAMVGGWDKGLSTGKEWGGTDGKDLHALLEMRGGRE